MSDISQTFHKVQRMLAEHTGNELEDITLESELVEELLFTPVDFKRIVGLLNAEYDINLDVSEITEEVETVEDLVVVVHEKIELE